MRAMEVKKRRDGNDGEDEDDDVMQGAELEEENYQVVLGPHIEILDVLEVSDTEDEGERSRVALFAACRDNRSEVVQGLLRGDADLTLCNHRGQTALHVSPPDLQEKMVRWMTRPHLSPQAQLLQAAWQGDLGAVRHLLSQTDSADVNIPNSDGATAVMLAIRDVDLFEGMAMWLPWEHKPVEVVKELLRFSAELRARDHNGCSALHYAANLTSALMEEIIPILIEALGHTEVDPTSSSTFDKYLFQDLEFGDSDTEQEAGSLFPHHQTRSHRHSDRTLSQTEAFLRTPENCPQSDKKEFSQADKGIPTCSQNAMETLKNTGRANQDVRRASRGLCLPSLSNSNRHSDCADAVLSSGFLSTRTPCRPVPPTQRQRTRSVVEASPPCRGLLCVSASSQLSQSAPSIMEPLLCPNTMMQARAHIQTRLSSQNTSNDQKGPFPVLHARTPKLLVPLDGRPKDCKALPSLKPHAPLKPITRSPLCSRTELRKERLSWGSLRNSRSKAGSEDSGSSSSSSSSSSHCSINLETEDDDNDDDDGQVQETSSKEKGLKFVKDGMLQRSSNASNANQSKEAAESESLKECNYSQKVDPLGVRDFESNTKSDTSVFSEDKRNMNRTTESKTGISNKMTNDVRDLQDDATGWFEEKYENGQIISEQIEPTRKVFCDQETKAKETRAHGAAVEKTGFFPVDPKKYEKMFKARNKESKTRMNCRLKANNSTTHSLTKDPSILGSNRSKTSSKYSGVSTVVKTKSKKSPEYFGKTRDTSLTKVKLSIKSGNAAYFSADTLTLHKASEPPQSNETHKQSPVRELRSAQQFKKQCFGGKSPRSKSAVDLITYRDMFQQIQSGTEGPAMYEMFAGPLFENLRVSSSCEKLKERQPQRMATKKTKPNHKATNKPVQNKAKRNSAESTAALTKSKAKPVSSQTKPQSITNSCRTEGSPKPTVEVGTTKEFSHKSPKDEYEDHILSTIMEALSKDGSETLERDDKTLTGTTTPFYGVDSRFMENHVASSGASTDNSANQHPELTPSLNPQQANTNPSTSLGSSCLMSPVYKKFLEEVGEGPLTDDLLQCLAEELISLDERDVSAAPEDSEQGKREFRGADVSGQNTFAEVAPTDGNTHLGSGLVANDTITWAKGEVLGKGAYGTVYCGLTSQGQLIAVKQVCLDSSDPDAAKKEYNRLQGEVDLLKTLRHSNIVGFLGTSLYQHVVSIFMEYIPGGSIASILHRFGPLPERVLALYTHQILEGVAFLHQNRVIHRDLKGNNVMLMPTGVIKLIDFGCARRLSCLNHTAPNSGELLKSVHGTPYWMAPEVISESGYGRKSDIWSVGCTVFEMATGKPPLAHMDKMAALFYIGARRGLMPTLPDGFSDNAKDFVKICLTSDQSLRPSADQLLRHSFIPKGQTNIKYWEAQRKNCCGP
ncbi:mitogen-activated protein kinase kinase kinase 19 isoform X2 [Fundulus heteroclitus]|uniref:mitogen-activated protein kinase kinase kinase 19 isoform X2 n=1 Tax=Fundulus heteroclitus TaxID=8078 RepID=UPI00165B2861|nr:mitogen-activated protein kinase kinase kinase 19 isoform X2 [Fundulus heteroclitus]